MNDTVAMQLVKQLAQAAVDIHNEHMGPLYECETGLCSSRCNTLISAYSNMGMTEPRDTEPVVSWSVADMTLVAVYAPDKLDDSEDWLVAGVTEKWSWRRIVLHAAMHGSLIWSMERSV